MTRTRTLTQDEKKASEAAFKGLPFNPKWSEAAKRVYEGLSRALGNQEGNALQLSQEPMNIFTPDSADYSPESQENQIAESLDDEGEEMPRINFATDSLPLQSRKDAIAAGLLKDATPAAKQVGLEFPVGLTNALWEHYVADSNDSTEDQIQTRLNDLMTGLRLRLAGLRVGVPLVDVPFLLQTPSQSVPQLSLAFALFHKDPVEGDCLLLIHPGEVFSTRQNFSNN